MARAVGDAWQLSFHLCVFLFMLCFLRLRQRVPKCGNMSMCKNVRYLWQNLRTQTNYGELYGIWGTSVKQIFVLTPSGSQRWRGCLECSTYHSISPFLVFVKLNMINNDKCLHFSTCACHPCAGAMLIFSASFLFNG